MHPTGGSLHVFGQFAWFEVGSGNMALSRAAHQRIAQAEGWLSGLEFSLFLPGQKGRYATRASREYMYERVAIAYIETGKRWAKLSTLNKIASSLSVSVADLYKGI